MSAVVVFSDGCALHNGRGAHAAIIIPPGAEVASVVVATAKRTTNNRQELKAVIAGLECVPVAEPVVLVTDSNYVRLGATEWLPRWRSRNWRTAARKPVKNRALWEQLASELAHRKVRWVKVLGHARNPLNEWVDGVAQRFARASDAASSPTSKKVN